MHSSQPKKIGCAVPQKKLLEIAECRHMSVGLALAKKSCEQSIPRWRIYPAK
jgi:hypothetical protein